MPLCCGINIFIEVYVDGVCSNSRTCRPFIALGRSSSGEVDESTGLWRPGEAANDYAGRTAETYVNEALRSLLEDDEYLLENLLVPFKNGRKTEIDAVLITRKAIFCIDFEIVYQGLGHEPRKLEKEKSAVYSFCYKKEDDFLKIGQTDKNSKARYEYQHYNPDAAISSLARSLISDPSMVGTVDKGNAGRWIKDNCERFDVIIDASKHDKLTLISWRAYSIISLDLNTNGIGGLANNAFPPNI